jgi:hydroxymethylbilane synthase
VKGGRVRVGTRGSKLALAQADSLVKELKKCDSTLVCELVVIKTRGDRILHSPLSEISGKGLFITEIEEALLRDEIDLAVHSLKDLPSELPEELELGAVLKRQDARDALVSRSGKKLAGITDKETIGTSSLRRRAQLLHYDSHFRIIDIRGNIDTRLRKMESGDYDALVLAASGLQRAGFDHKITEYIDPGTILPAACQGIIGIEIRREDRKVSELMQAINHEPTMLAALGERSFLKAMEGGCQVPIGCLSGVKDDTFTITGLVSDLSGRRTIKGRLSGEVGEAMHLGRELAAQILSNGGREILVEIRNRHG